MGVINSTDIPGISIELEREYIVVRIERESALTMLYHVQEDVLRHIERYALRSVILDFSRVAVDNPSICFALCSTCKMVSLMAEQTVITGITGGMSGGFYSPDSHINPVIFLDSVDTARKYIISGNDSAYYGNRADSKQLAQI